MIVMMMITMVVMLSIVCFLTDDDEGRPCDRRRARREAKASCPAETMCAQKREFVKKLIKTSEGY